MLVCSSPMKSRERYADDVILIDTCVTQPTLFITSLIKDADGSLWFVVVTVCGCDSLLFFVI